MLWLALVWVLGQDNCTDRSPGLSKCITYKLRHDGTVDCRAACYVISKPDGGTSGYTVKAEGKRDEAQCKLELQRQATNGCKP